MKTKSVKKILTAVFAAMLAFPAASAQVYADEKTNSGSSVEVINHVETGAVIINLKEYQLNEDGKEEAYVDNKVVVPGQDISKIARITNTGYKCWIRGKISVVSEDGIKNLSDDIATIHDPEHWKKVGDYWYYTLPLEHDEHVDFLKSIHVPEEWTEEYSDKKFQVIVHVDAVQYEHFTPKFDSEAPWFGTVIETSIYDKTDIVPKSNDTFLVEYRGGAEGLIKKGADFFDNWGALMPGDTAEDFVVVQNSYASPVNIYFRTEAMDEEHLSREVHLRIWRGTELIYDGDMLGTLNEMLLAQNLKKDEQFILRFEVSLPEELNNSYALNFAKTKWIFRTELVNPNIFSGNPRTADTFNKAMYTALLGGAALVAIGGIYLIVKRRKEEEEA